MIQVCFSLKNVTQSSECRKNEVTDPIMLLINIHMNDHFAIESSNCCIIRLYDIYFFLKKGLIKRISAIITQIIFTTMEG